jgi:hypothetical protein
LTIKALQLFFGGLTARLKTRPFKAALAVRALGRHSATHEVDDFEAVAIFERDLRPAVPRSDFAVELNGNAVGFHIQRFDQGRESEVGWRHGIRERALFSIDVEFHLVDFLTREPVPYSLLRRANLRVTVRPSWLAWTMTEESGKEDSSTSIEIAALPAASVTAWV